MAFVKQESSFRHDARPPKRLHPWVYLLGGVYSAYGYAQAQDPAWEDFKKATNNGGSRTNFDDALDVYVAGTSAKRVVNSVSR